MKRTLFFLLSIVILNIGCSNTLENSIYDKKSDPHVDEPTIGNAFASEESIVVRNIQSSHCEEYYVYYKKVLPGVSQDEIITQDVSLWSIAAHINRGETEDIVIEDLEAGEMYVIAVIGIDSFGNKSKPVFFEETGRENIAFLIPLDFTPDIKINNTVAGDCEINVNGITSNLDTDFKYYLYTREVADNDDINVIVYENVENWKLGAVINWTGNDSTVISSLDGNRNYALAIIGKDSEGKKTEPFFWKQADSEAVLETIMPYATPAKLQNVHLNLLSDGRTIQVNNIYDANATGYLVQYTRAWENNWQTITLDAIPGEAVETQFTGAVWETYNIRVCGINSDGGGNGEWSSIMQISTDPDNTFSGVNVQWVVVDDDKRAVNLSIASLPVNTSSVKVTGECSWSVVHYRYEQTPSGPSLVSTEIYIRREIVDLVANPYNGNVISSNILEHSFDNSEYPEFVYASHIITFEIVCENRNGDVINSQNYVFDLN